MRAERLASGPGKAGRTGLTSGPGGARSWLAEGWAARAGWAGVEEWRARGLKGWRVGWAAREGRGRSETWAALGRLGLGWVTGFGLG